jgi:hypothetical protein
MQIYWQRLNIYLLAGLAVLAAGCKSTGDAKNKNLLSTLKIHVETDADAGEHTKVVKVFREHEIPFTIHETPILTEANVKEARIVEILGGFALRLQFDRQGSWLLEEYSTQSRGRHLLVYSDFASFKDPKLHEGRWLAAPMISRSITDGTLTVVPDASREEADRIALGLNNVAKKAEEAAKWW